MFYMFSGPDFLYADAFYSKATTYVLSALEPPGSVPDLTRLPRGGVEAALYNVEHSLGSILSFSFFITKKMKVDLRAGQINGTLPILYVFLARSGKTIRERHVRSRSTTRARRISPTKIPARTPRMACGSCSPAATAWQKTLYYFSTDLSNPGVRATGFLKFCATLAPGNSLIKSASYLLHSGNFSTVRDFILANSATIIQDDSGIPLGVLQSEEMALLPVRPLCRSDRRISREISGAICRAVPASPADGFRHRLSLAIV